MRMVLLVHVIGGGSSLVSGALALYAAKGGALHRRSGMLFFYSMLALSISGAGVAALRGGEASVIGGLLTAYLVITGLTTVRPPFAGSRGLDLAALMVALGVGLASVTLGAATIAAGESQRHGIPVPIFFLHGTVALIAGGSDLRILRSGPLRGASRLARHLWRMCFALFIAAASFFLGPSRRIPPPLRIPALRVLLAMLPLLVMSFWLWRVRARRTAGGIPALRSHQRVLNDQGLDEISQTRSAL